MRPGATASARERGSSLLLVMGILVVFALVLGVLASILLTDLRATRRRANDRYAVELARSGVDWARAWLMEKGQLPPGRLKRRGRRDRGPCRRAAVRRQEDRVRGTRPGALGRARGAGRSRGDGGIGSARPAGSAAHGPQRDAMSVTFTVIVRSFLTSFTGTVSPIFCVSSAVTRSS